MSCCAQGSGKGVSTVPINVKFKVRSVKLYLNSVGVAGSNQIDAVGLTDDRGKEHFATLAKAYDVHGEGPVTRLADLRPAVERALRVVKDQGKMALVDVVCEAR